MSIFCKTIVAVKVEDDSATTMECLRTVLDMEDIRFIYREGVPTLVLEELEDGTTREAPIGSWVTRDNAGLLKSITEEELFNEYGEPINTDREESSPPRKLFVSLPMAGRTEEEITKEFYRLIDVAGSYFDEDFDVVDTIEHEGPEEDLEGDSLRLYYLGKSIQRLAEADVAIFGEGWTKARGCRIEREACRLYNITVIETEAYIPEKNLAGCDK